MKLIGIFDFFVKALRAAVLKLSSLDGNPGWQAEDFDTLLAMIKSLLGTTAEDPSIQLVLTDLTAAGKVTINDKGAIQYSL